MLWVGSVGPCVCTWVDTSTPGGHGEDGRGQPSGALGGLETTLATALLERPTLPAFLHEGLTVFPSWTVRPPSLGQLISDPQVPEWGTKVRGTRAEGGQHPGTPVDRDTWGRGHRYGGDRWRRVHRWGVPSRGRGPSGTCIAKSPLPLPGGPHTRRPGTIPRVTCRGAGQRPARSEGSTGQARRRSPPAARSLRQPSCFRHSDKQAVPRMVSSPHGHAGSADAFAGCCESKTERTAPPFRQEFLVQRLLKSSLFPKFNVLYKTCK